MVEAAEAADAVEAIEMLEAEVAEVAELTMHRNHPRRLSNAPTTLSKSVFSYTVFYVVFGS